MQWTCKIVVVVVVYRSLKWISNWNRFISQLVNKITNLTNIQCQLWVLGYGNLSRYHQSIGVQYPALSVSVCLCLGVNRICILTSTYIRADVTSCKGFALPCVPLCVIGLAPAGHRVADTCASARVHVLDHDEGMLLQRGHGQVPVIRHVLQEAAVSRPDRVAHLKDPSSVRTHLERESEGQRARHYHLHLCLNLSRDLLCMSTPSLFPCLIFPYFTGWMTLFFYFIKEN